MPRLPPSTPPAEPHPGQPSLDVRAHCSRPARVPSTSMTHARASSLMRPSTSRSKSPSTNVRGNTNADETGFAQGRKGGRAARAWLWVVATALVVVFHIARNRNGKVARHLLGEDFAGFLTTDRWSAYEWVDAGPRQLCWAHLTRDFQGFIDRGGRGGRIGRELMRERNRFFKLRIPAIVITQIGRA